MNKIDVAVKGVLIKDSKMLLVKRSASDETAAGIWESVGGKLIFGETLEEAIKREFLEEVGIQIDVERLLFSSTFLASPTRQIVIIVYLCNCSCANVTLSNEHETYKWATKSEIIELLPKYILDDYEYYYIFDLL